MNKWYLKNGSTIEFGDSMDKYETASECLRSKQVEVCDIKTSIKQNIKWLENSIKEYQEKLRIDQEKLKLIKKNKDLEAYINLDRQR